jgi:hypothetical protein
VPLLTELRTILSPKVEKSDLPMTVTKIEIRTGTQDSKYLSNHRNREQHANTSFAVQIWE